MIARPRPPSSSSSPVALLVASTSKPLPSSATSTASRSPFELVAHVDDAGRGPPRRRGGSSSSTPPSARASGPRASPARPRGPGRGPSAPAGRARCTRPSPGLRGRPRRNCLLRPLAVLIVPSAVCPVGTGRIPHAARDSSCATGRPDVTRSGETPPGDRDRLRVRIDEHEAAAERRATAPSVPLPAKRSRHQSPGRDDACTIRRRTPSGFCVG